MWSHNKVVVVLGVFTPGTGAIRKQIGCSCTEGGEMSIANPCKATKPAPLRRGDL